MVNILREENEVLSQELAQGDIQVFVTYEDLLLMYEDMGEYPLYKGIVKALISNKLGKHLSIEMPFLTTRGSLKLSEFQ